MYKLNITTNNIQVKDVYDIPKCLYGDCLDYAQRVIDMNALDCVVLDKRSRCSLKLEMCTHNALYWLGIAMERTRDCDLNYPQKWWEKIGYAVFGALAWIFVK